MDAKGQSNKGKKINKTGCMSWVNYCEIQMLKQEDENTKLKLLFHEKMNEQMKENEKLKEKLKEKKQIMTYAVDENGSTYGERCLPIVHQLKGEIDTLKHENEKMKEQLNLCRLCCKEALNGEWEINDEGFQSQIDQIDKLIGKGVGVEWEIDV